ncbi:orotidine 5`-phosphate decarboxylase [Legionella beliardensis]|uniref:Orotidine 5'-phosphate decarboxylase n=1 Tax=Legionella beliardensis TaxID=91822 RepID=A0A378I1W6_9GAMM|nr:orotidine-5'-phosphate decarboxylase [Legionella beliardensis]STX28942.1 orotidine 5`-phosphate decarboxylase [Legionella beliardensis]
MNTKIIIALDFFNQAEALALIKDVNPEHCAVKIGSEMFTLFGADFVRHLIKQNFNVFLDLKFHDIPNTVAHACRAAAELGVWMVNVHASGGLKMMQAAREALTPYGLRKPLLIGVTVLTSMAAEDLPAMGIISPLEEQIIRLTKLTYQAGLDGVVCSAHEAPLVKSLCGPSFLAVTPGIRLPHSGVDDQIRITSPEQAIKMGSDYLVIGRPITRAANPKAVIDSIIHSLST